MQQGPLTEEQLEWLDDILMKYSTDTSLVDASELDGMLTAIVSAPVAVPPAEWLPAIWGGEEEMPDWESEEEFRRFHDLLSQHMNDIVDRLSGYPDQFEPLFGINTVNGEDYTVVEEWCFGYMKGVDLGDWSSLPPSQEPSLLVIALHGREENFERLETLTVEEYEISVEAIRPAAISLYVKQPLH
ncbi:UPF0149 family protein [Pantoea coffeiphila]|uniref:UPF0149 family protein n=1 Tax=Pantoea coffeiphila TaxID=1465635 RepID=UPI00195FDD8F|nr:UPF0149 family protein [Pantoea coffeiphila]MBM7343351.1 uncharacterized protein [Pantoea coffeiphila]